MASYCHVAFGSSRCCPASNEVTQTATRKERDRRWWCQTRHSERYTSFIFLFCPFFCRRYGSFRYVCCVYFGLSQSGSSSPCGVCFVILVCFRGALIFLGEYISCLCWHVGWDVFIVKHKITDALITSLVWTVIGSSLEGSPWQGVWLPASSVCSHTFKMVEGGTGSWGTGRVAPASAARGIRHRACAPGLCFRRFFEAPRLSRIFFACGVAPCFFLILSQPVWLG